MGVQFLRVLREAFGTIDRLSAAEASRLRASLRSESASLVTAIQSQGTWTEDTVGGAIGAIAHVAYHLGAIRQRLAVGALG